MWPRERVCVREREIERERERGREREREREKDALLYHRKVKKRKVE